MAIDELHILYNYTGIEVQGSNVNVCVCVMEGNLDVRYTSDMWMFEWERSPGNLVVVRR